VGKVYSGGEVIEANVRLDEFTLTHHVLLIGTTGSGKTTFLKRVVSQDSMEKQSVVFDRQGDFVRLALERLGDATIVMPVTSLMESSTMEDYVNLFLNRYGKAKDVMNGNGYVSLEYENSRLRLVPYSIAFSEVMMNFHKMTPYMSPGASLVWESLMRKTKELLIYNLMEYFGKDALPYAKALEFYETEIKPRLSIDNLTVRPVSFQPKKLQVVTGKSKTYVRDDKGNLQVDVPKAFKDAMDSLNLAPQTKDSIIRLLKSYKEFGIFDVPGTFNHIGEDVWKEKNIIVDLSWVLDYTASVEALATISYKLLSDFFKYKDEMYKQGQQSTLSLLIMDEAHEYFPQASDENAKGVIEDLINKLMRLGRVRRLGVILATHYPDDLNELVIQLSNTKVIMRNDPQVLKKLSAEDYSDILTNAEPGVGLIRSMRFTNVLFKSLVP
jgi:DNA helicase HerA-like ATPase